MLLLGFALYIETTFDGNSWSKSEDTKVFVTEFFSVSSYFKAIVADSKGVITQLSHSHPAVWRCCE